MAEIYKHFAKTAQETEFVCDFSKKSAQEMFQFESTGKGEVSSDNGYAIGKKYMDITVAMWLEDIEKGFLNTKELYDDQNLPNWWLDMVIPKKLTSKKVQGG